MVCSWFFIPHFTVFMVSPFLPFPLIFSFFFFLFSFFLSIIYVTVFMICARFLYSLSLQYKRVGDSGAADHAAMGHTVLHALVGFCFHLRSAEGTGFDLRRVYYGF